MICSTCKFDKSLECFEKRKDCKNGYRKQCKECRQKVRSDYYKNNVKYLKKCRREHYIKNKKEYLKQCSEYAKNNRDKKNNNRALRRANKKKATPKWANLEKIKVIYEKAKWLEEVTGLEYHVDHIIPITSDTVCGFHTWENLQILEKSENLKKGNSYEPKQ